jgi:hypothetical protein
MNDIHFTKPKRRSNSTSLAAGHNLLKSKFEAVDPEVIEYDEDLHGPAAVIDDHELEKMSTSSSTDTAHSVDEEEAAVKEMK